MTPCPKPTPREQKPPTRLKRSYIKASRKPIKVKKRTPSEFARIYGSRARVRWVQAQPCVVDHAADSGIACRPSENAHIAISGTGRKADSDTIVPLCPWHHTGSRLTSLHALGRTQFEAYHHVDLATLARRTKARWLAYEERCQPD